jgi:NitT/TauT family transport system ATP-binding protein
MTALDQPAVAVRPLIEIEGVHRVYEADSGPLHALKDIHLTINDGEFISIIGQSGCGKSTLLNLLAGLDGPTRGAITLDGRTVDRPLPDDIGYVFQRAVLLPWKTIIDNVLLPVEIMGRPRKNYVDRAHELLDLVGLSGFELSYPSQLSGGMQQRASIVRALLHEPKILLMDEPFGALDAMTRERMNAELLKIWATTDATIAFVTHDLREAAFLSDRVVVMSARPGTIREVVVSPLERPRTADVVYSDDYRDLVMHLGDLIV